MTLVTFHLVTFHCFVSQDATLSIVIAALVASTVRCVRSPTWSTRGDVLNTARQDSSMPTLQGNVKTEVCNG